MAMTQERIAAIITAARSYQERYSSVISVIELFHKMVCDGAITGAEAIERLHVQFGEKGMPLDATIVLEREFTRYKLTRKRNDYMREYQRRRRTGAFRAPSDEGASRAPYDDGASRAPYDDATTNAMTLAEVEAAIAGAGASRAPSNAASADAAPSNEPEPSIAFNADLSVDDLL